MTPTVWTYLIVCPLVLLAGFVDSVAGGGGVISLPAYLLAGIPVKLAAGTNKLANGCGTALAVAKYAKSGNIEGDVRSGLVDDADHTERITHPLNLESVGAYG